MCAVQGTACSGPIVTAYDDGGLSFRLLRDYDGNPSDLCSDRMGSGRQAGGRVAAAIGCVRSRVVGRRILGSV